MVARNPQIGEQAYRSRALQYLAWLDFPATRQQILAHFARKNTPMELYEDTLALPERTFASPGEFADADSGSTARIDRQFWPRTFIHSTATECCVSGFANTP